MTRFARAKGSKASNEKTPDDGTPWEVMKEQLLKAKQESEEAKKRLEVEKQRVENYEKFLAEQKVQKRKVEWCDFPEAEIKRNKNNVGQQPSKPKKKKKNKQNLQIHEVVDNQNGNDLGKQKIGAEDQKKKNKQNLQSNEIVDNKKSRNGNDLGKQKIGAEDQITSSNTENKEQPLSKKNKNKKKSKNVNNVQGSNQNNNFKSNQNESDQQNSESNKKENKGNNGKRDNMQRLNTNISNSNSDNPGKNQKKKKNKLMDGQPIRRKEINDRSFQLIINGKEVELMRFEGFPIMKKDAERLAELKNNMIKKGIPKSEVQRTIKLERRRAEKALARLRREVCYNCRKGGHNLSDCPDLKSKIPGVDAADGVCFKCGSTEHRQSECKVQRDNGFRFATCFICKESGHIARQCPDNPKGLYPNGGCCKLCGDVTHLRKDCPTVNNKKEETSVKLSTLDSTDNIEDIGIKNNSSNVEEPVKKPKKIKF